MPWQSIHFASVETDFPMFYVLFSLFVSSFGLKTFVKVGSDL